MYVYMHNAIYSTCIHFVHVECICIVWYIMYKLYMYMTVSVCVCWFEFHLPLSLPLLSSLPVYDVHRTMQ